MNLIAKKRNARQEECLGSKPYPKISAFIAVGVAHLGGDLGVINLLRKGIHR
jgi:uncharacterized protein YbaP (TraB family)